MDCKRADISIEQLDDILTIAFNLPIYGSRIRELLMFGRAVAVHELVLFGLPSKPLHASFIQTPYHSLEQPVSNKRLPWRASLGLYTKPHKSSYLKTSSGSDEIWIP